MVGEDLKVATVLTVCGIETVDIPDELGKNISMLQQCLPFAVLKLLNVLEDVQRIYGELQQCLPFAVLKQVLNIDLKNALLRVATVLTVCGIETTRPGGPSGVYLLVATVLTVCGIET